MAYKVTQRISSCRAPPGVRRTICPENLYCIGKMAVFPAQSSILWGSMVACNRRKDRDCQITNGVGSDDTTAIPGDIIHFFEEDDKYVS